MASVDVYNMQGKKVGTHDVADAVFGVRVQPSLVHEAIVMQEANARTHRANSKDRSEVRGGGRKPWKQKGTGRARHGSRRSPIWVGGGVTFGPLLARVFGKKMNKKAKRKALAMVLSDKVQNGTLIALDALKLEAAKTKHVAAMRQALPGADKSALIVTGKESQDVVRATQNLPKTETIGIDSLNVRDLARYQYVIAATDVLDDVVKQYQAA